MPTRRSRSAAIRAQLKHPIIDIDGHMLELTPVLLDYVRDIGGAKMAERFAGTAGVLSSFAMTPEQRRETWTAMQAWWPFPTKNTLDRATASLPKLLHERMDELGMDFSVLYPTTGLRLLTDPSFDDPELRQVACRSINRFYADLYREYASRMTPVAIVLMHTPQEAVQEIEYAVKTLGLKAVMLAGHVLRPVVKTDHRYTGAGHEWFRLDTFGIDSEHNYDPVWAKCVELGVSPGTHNGSVGWGSRRSVSNFVYNHIGHFAASAEALCKSLFLGGVTRRFPNLRVAFLEGGAGWACSLYADLIGHWEKRNPKALDDVDPANLDLAKALALVGRYGDSRTRGKRSEIETLYSRKQPKPAAFDDFARCEIERAEDIRDLFVPNFYFGCEADDPLNASAFNSKVNPFDAKLRAVFGSDIGHFDVPNMREVVEEAYELVERELLTEEDFREFVFLNPVRLYAEANPRFFEGTVCEQAVDAQLKRQRLKANRT